MKLAVVIPYRDRAAHLREFIPAITQQLMSESIDFELHLVEQSANGLFNKGVCCNVGFLLAQGFDWYCFHDVDLLPIKNSDYSWPVWPTQMVHASSKHDFRPYESDNLGGVCLFRPEHYRLINGFSNNFWGWGGEDNQLSWRCFNAGLKIDHREIVYQHLADLNPADMSHYKENMAYLADPVDYQKDGLNSLDYELLESRTEAEFYHHLIEIKSTAV